MPTLAAFAWLLVEYLCMCGSNSFALCRRRRALCHPAASSSPLSAIRCPPCDPRPGGRRRRRLSLLVPRPWLVCSYGYCPPFFAAISDSARAHYWICLVTTLHSALDLALCCSARLPTWLYVSAPPAPRFPSLWRGKTAHRHRLIAGPCVILSSRASSRLPRTAGRLGGSIPAGDLPPYSCLPETWADRRREHSRVSFSDSSSASTPAESRRMSGQPSS
ncbi:hypothetical protein BDV95DRAFT_10071 [Massariosphaeria phaeospora]|uniref:Secreted protein n=1 Tax=Massariosphaeria phaeospora TaxID=100035 RepID=A0A7C8IF50_9PLEO|nr:hypothetical protein BDV95DRAFT_10071 [Massariosphaeria phaeospora]